MKVSNERSTAMKYSVPGFILCLIIIGLLTGATFAQYGSSTSYNLQWKVIESGGNEGDDVTSASYKLSSCIGQPTPVIDGPTSSTSYDFYPGFRKIDLDLRYPYSWFTFIVEYASDTSFGLRWAGVDTTIEDGVGWGVWNYDIRYKIGAGGWTPWLIDVTDTMATFGPESPVDVTPGETYHFQIRAQDKARNEAPWTTPWMDQDSTIVNYVVQFCVYTYAPGLPTDAGNYATLEYYDDTGAPVYVDLWEGSCVQVWCVPNSEAEITRVTSGSDGQERWVVNTPTEDTLWTIDGTETAVDVYYWHQLQPIIYLEGTDVMHTVETLEHEQFGPGHLESGLFTMWTEWTDYGSMIEFIDSTTGSPVRHALPTDSVRFHNVTAFFQDSIHYMAAGNAITIQTNFTGGEVNADGVWYPSPYSTDWFDLSTHDISVYDTVIISGCEMWVFDYWEDDPGITDTARTVTITMDSTFTAIYHREFKVDISNTGGFGIPTPGVGSYWFTEGDTVTGSMDTTGVMGQTLVGYIGTGSALSGGGTEFWFIIHDCSTIDWVWTPTTGDMCTLTVYSRYGHPHPDGVYIVPCGTDIWCSVEDSSYEDGAWQYCTGWRGDGVVVPATGSDNIVNFTLSGTGWLVWEWNDEDLLPLTIASTPGPHGSPTPPIGTHWLPYGSTQDAWVINPDGTWRCTGYIGFGSVVSTSADSVNFVLDAPTGIDWQWIDWGSGDLDTLWVFSPYGDPVPSIGMHVYPHGIDITAFVPTPSGTHDCTGWIGTGSVPATGATNTVSFTLNEFSTLVWVWDGVDMLPFMVSNPTGHDAPVPAVGTHWYPPGTVIDAWVTSPDGAWFCVGYNAFGSLPSFGYTDSVHFTLLLATWIEWLWSDDVVQLNVIAPSYSGANPPPGITYHPVGRHIVATTNDSVYEGGDTRHICTGYDGGGSAPASGTDTFAVFDIMVDSWLQWNYLDQFYLDLTHTGLPATVDPDTLGVIGWYDSGDSAVLITDSVVWDGPDAYIFIEWDDADAGAIIGDEFAESTFVIMDAPYRLTAVFASAIQVTITKSPTHDTPGWILVDGDTFFTGTYTAFWETGSSHDIEVSVMDSTYDFKYEFVEWRDDPAALPARTVAPSTDITYYADYNHYWHVILEKFPPADTFGTLTVDMTPYSGPASVRQDMWFLDASSHSIDVSDPDSSTYEKYHFQQWSDGTSTTSLAYGPVSAADSIVAIYTQEYFCRIEKVPPQDHGAIYLEGTTYDRVGTLDFWAFADSIYEIGVAAGDTVGDYDSIYIFLNWEMDGSTDTLRDSPVVTGPDTFRALYSAIEVMIRIEIGHYGVCPHDSVVWNITDSLTFGEERTMTANDSIKIYNLSNVSVDFGLNISAIWDTCGPWIPDPYWNPHWWREYNRFVLRARFNDDSEPPVTWAMTRDFVGYPLVWATSDPEPTLQYFGPGGENIPPPPGANTEMLWFQFQAPSSSDEPGHTRCIVVPLTVRPHMP